MHSADDKTPKITEAVIMAATRADARLSFLKSAATPSKNLCRCVEVIQAHADGCRMAAGEAGARNDRRENKIMHRLADELERISVLLGEPPVP